MNVNAPAMTASATPACAARAETAPSMSAPLESFPDDEAVLPVLAAGGEPELEAVATTDVAAAAKGVLVVDFDSEEGAREGAEPVAEVLFVVVLPLPPGRYDGGGTALDGSTRAPVPQGIAWPSGWVGFGAGTVAPVESAMAKRPVQRRSVAFPP
jgi:hypothetical protein